MRPVNADTASRLHCCNDYASGLMAPTSGTRQAEEIVALATLAAMRSIKPPAKRRRHPASGLASGAITIAFSDNQRILKEAGLFA
jgi:hypothetical protein